MDTAFEYIMKNSLELEESYPYTSSTGTTGSCKYDQQSGVGKVVSYVDVASGSAAQLKAALAK